MQHFVNNTNNTSLLMRNTMSKLNKSIDLSGRNASKFLPNIN